MSILIKGMKLPTRCEACFAYRFKAEYGHGYCRIANAKVLGHGNARLNNCPLVEIPKHGRLIDADEMERTMSDTVQGNIRCYPYSDTLWDFAFRWIDNQPTIIEADGE